MQRWATRLYPAPHSVYLDGVGHYFHSKLNTLQTIIREHHIAIPNATVRLAAGLA